MTNDQRQRRFDEVERRIARPMDGLTVIALALLAIEALDNVHGSARTLLTVLDILVWACFAAEYITLLLLAPSKRSYVRAHPLDLLIVLVPLLRPLRLVRGVRALRLLRAARLLPLLGRFRERTGQTLAYVIATATVVVVIAAVAVSTIERDRDGNIHGVGDGLWWAITTMTTVGYGDLYPTTGAGRVFGVVLMVVGISVLSVVTASLASWFNRAKQQVEEERLTSVERKLDEILARLDSFREERPSPQKPPKGA